VESKKTVGGIAIGAILRSQYIDTTQAVLIYVWEAVPENEGSLLDFSNSLHGKPEAR
jgi:hypothetical protein